MQQFSHHSHLHLFTGENLVSKSPLQVQASGEGEGNGGTESQQSGELAARTLSRKACREFMNNHKVSLLNRNSHRARHAA